MACPEFDKACDSAKNGGISQAKKARIREEMKKHLLKMLEAQNKGKDEGETQSPR